MDRWWNDTDKRNAKYWDINVHYFVYRNSLIYWPGIEPGPLGWMAGK